MYSIFRLGIIYRMSFYVTYITIKLRPCLQWREEPYFYALYLSLIPFECFDHSFAIFRVYERAGSGKYPSF